MADAAFAAGVLSKTRRTALRTLPPSKREGERKETRASHQRKKENTALSRPSLPHSVLLGADGKDLTKKSTVRKGR